MPNSNFHHYTLTSTYVDATVHDWYTFRARPLPFLDGQKDTPAESIVFPFLDAIPFGLHFVLQETSLRRCKLQFYSRTQWQAASQSKVVALALITSHESSAHSMQWFVCLRKPSAITQIRSYVTLNSTRQMPADQTQGRKPPPPAAAAWRK